jgi:hypothetical protein
MQQWHTIRRSSVVNPNEGIPITGHTWVEVETVIPGVRWQGTVHPVGGKIVARWYEMQPAIGASQVRLVRVLTTAPDDTPAVELVPGPAPAEGA